MTTVLGIRVPGQGAVMVADGKVSDDTGRIWSTTAKKLLKLTAATVGVAGNLLVLDELRRAKPHTAEGVKDFLRDSAFLTPFELICYDHINDQLWTLDQNGMYVEFPYWVAAGAGGAVASGALITSSPPPNLDAALVIGKQAVKASAILNGYCGGVTHWCLCPIVVPQQLAAPRKAEFYGSIARLDPPAVRIGKRLFDFEVSRFVGQRPPKVRMKVAVEISSLGTIVSVRPQRQ